MPLRLTNDILDTMKKTLIKTLIVFIVILTICSCQQEKYKIEIINLTIEHSKRIPYASISIRLTREKSETKAHLVSSPRNDDEEWKYSRIDTIITIDNKTFDELDYASNNLMKKDLSKSEMDGKDGTESVLVFGTNSAMTLYKFWSPDYETETRGLTEYLEICKKLVEVVGLKPDDIL